MSVAEPAAETAAVLNPFNLLLDPAAVLRAHEHASDTANLPRRVYRPLDQPARAGKVDIDIAEFDAAVDDGEADGGDDDHPEFLTTTRAVLW